LQAIHQEKVKTTEIIFKKRQKIKLFLEIIPKNSTD